MSAGCSPLPPPPYALAFAADGPAPRILRTGEEIVVPLTVRNTGARGWDPARIHLSYHWLWLVPRELTKRSRRVPFHEGIRSEIGRALLPGGDSRVGARLLAPDVPGLYWLQWDMVEEGVNWFTQLSPRQPRRLVIVLPTLAGLFAPLPLLCACAGAITLTVRRRRARFLSPRMGAGLADVFWCTAALLSKPLILIHEAVLEPTAMAYWLLAVTAVVPPLMVTAILPRRARAWALLGVGVFATLLVLGDVLYYRFFGDVLSTAAMLAARQTGQVSGSIRSLLTPAMVWLVIDLPFALWLVVAIAADPAPPAGGTPRRAAAIALAVVLTAGLLPMAPALAASRFGQVFRDRAVMEQLGPFGYHVHDAWSYARTTLFRPPVSAAEVARVREWLKERAPLRAGSGPAYGAAAGMNVIVVQVESLQDFAVDYVVNGQPVMPHLRGWRTDALRFTNVTDQTNEGRTSDAEFTTMTSLLPLDHGAAAFRYPGDHYVGVPRVLAEHGYATLSAVPFEAGFWNRRVMHPAYGFGQSLFEPDFTLTEQIGWGLNDRDFLQQMIPRLQRMPAPFAAWLITLSLHHPFEDFPDAHKVLSLGALDRTSFGNYLHTMRFFDTALEDFRSALQSAGMLDRTVLVVFGDHDAGFAHDPALAATIGIPADAAAWALNDRVPLFMRLPGRGAGGLAGDVPIAAGQTDFAPTLLALLGIDPSPLPYVGRNLLGQPGDVPVVRPFGDWLDRSHLLISRRDSEGGDQCYGLVAAALTDPANCRQADADARRARDASRLIVAEQLQQQLRESLR